MDNQFEDYKSEVAPDRTVLLAVAPSDFQDMEFQGIRQVMVEFGYNLEITSLKAGECHGMYGTVVRSDFPFPEIEPENYQALVFVGGTGISVLIDNEDAISLAQRFAQQNKIIGALSDAPLILIAAGVLPAGAKISASDPLRQAIRDGGFNYSDDHVSVDGHFITADNYQASQEFAHEMLAVFNRETDNQDSYEESDMEESA